MLRLKSDEEIGTADIRILPPIEGGAVGKICHTGVFNQNVDSVELSVDFVCESFDGSKIGEINWPELCAGVLSGFNQTCCYS